MKTLVSILVLAVSLSAHAPLVHAQWSSNPAINTPVCMATNLQQVPKILPDGSGGTIIAWMDFRNGNYDVYMQRLSGTGVARWPANGVALTNLSAEDSFPEIATDGSGGAIALWQRVTAVTNMYAQRIDSSGTVRWQANGVRINRGNSSALRTYRITSDGAGGAVLAWEEFGFDTNRVRLQRISSAGILQWDTSGVRVTTNVLTSLSNLFGAGVDGMFVVYNNAAGTYVQKINSFGARQWGTNGIAISGSTGPSNSGVLVSDGVGGIIASFVDSRNGNPDIFAQRFNGAGLRQWSSSDVLVCGATGTQYFPKLISDGASGGIIAWGDFRSSNQGVYVQKVNQSGSVQWTSDGIDLVGTANTSTWEIASDGVGGAIVVWSDRRAGFSNLNIFAQRISTGGTTLWTTNGTDICTASGNQSAQVIASDNSGNAVIAFEDERNGGPGFNVDIYAQKISRDGILGGTTSVSEDPHAYSYELQQNYPNPFNPSTVMRFSIPVGTRHDVSLQVFDVLGREVATLVNENLSAGSYETTFSANGLASGVYLYRLQAGNSVETKRMLLLR